MAFMRTILLVVLAIFVHCSYSFNPGTPNEVRGHLSDTSFSDLRGYLHVTQDQPTGEQVSHGHGDAKASLNALRDMMEMKEIIDTPNYNDMRCSEGECEPPLLPPGAGGLPMGFQGHSLLNISSLYLPNIATANPDCQADLIRLMVALVDIKDYFSKGILWPIQMVDSWGKMQDGIFVGNLNYVGFYQECLNVSVEAPKNRTFQGKYCYITYSKNTTESYSSMDDEALNEGVFEDMIDEEGVRPSLRMPIVSPFILHEAMLTGYGTCMPSSCTQQELLESVNDALAPVDFHVTSATCYVEGEKYTITGSEVFGIVFFSLLLALLVAASLVDVWITYWAKSSSDNHGALEYLLAFSVPHNLRKLFHLETRRNPKVVSSLHGIRFLSITWVVLGHQIVFSLSLVSNIAEVAELTKRPGMQVVTNADKSVDTFFMMSGLLVGLIFLRQMDSRGKFNAPMFYIHRIVRLVPPIAIAAAFVATLSGFLVNGPLSGGYKSSLKSCRHNWWMDLTFVSNLLYPHLKDMGEAYEGSSCLPQCWYTSADMQLHLISPAVMLPLYFWPKLGPWWLAGWTLISVIIPGAIIGRYGLNPTTLLVADSSAQDYMNTVYMNPWCRASPYIVGICAGYILYKAEKNPSIRQLKTWQAILGWVTSAIVALAVIFGIEKYNYMGLPGTVPHMSTTEAVFYGGLHRAAFGAAVAWVAVACHWGYGGPVNWFLTHPLWQPLSRLAYCIYLTSLPLQSVIFFNTRRPTYFTVYGKIQETCGVLLVIIFASIILTIIAESPILRLEKLLLQSDEKRSTKEPDPKVIKDKVNYSNSEDEEKTITELEFHRDLEETIAKQHRQSHFRKGCSEA